MVKYQKQYFLYIVLTPLLAHNVEMTWHELKQWLTICVEMKLFLLFLLLTKEYYLRHTNNIDIVYCNLLKLVKLAVSE